MIFVAAAPARAVIIGSPVAIGTISHGALEEISGVVDSRAHANTFWVHNDSGDAARFYAVSHSGDLLGTFPLAGASAVDWEDIAIGPKSGGGNYLYLGDIGDNNAIRPFVTIYRVDEPTTTTGATIPTSAYSTVHLQFPNGKRDVESLFADPISGDLFLVTKRTATPEVYSVSSTVFDVPGQTVMLTSLGNAGLPRTPTAADISPDGRFIAVRSSASASGYLYERAVGQSVDEALRGTGIRFTLGPESQGEALGWAADGNSLFTTSEFDGATSAPIHAYAFARLPGDYNNDSRVDAADYSVWRNHVGDNIGLPNEVDTLGRVTIEDYDLWKAHYGEAAANESSSLPKSGSFAIPEPASIVLLAMAVVSRLTRRRSS